MHQGVVQCLKKVGGNVSQHRALTRAAVSSKVLNNVLHGEYDMISNGTMIFICPTHARGKRIYTVL